MDRGHPDIARLCRQDAEAHTRRGGSLGYRRADLIPIWVEMLHRRRLENDPHRPSSIKRQKIGRNDPCPCGSGRKYKKCCGLN
ncbi:MULTISPECIES: SEC-C metal-binding domain-containing protein [Sphingomonadaceae]